MTTRAPGTLTRAALAVGVAFLAVASLVGGTAATVALLDGDEPAPTRPPGLVPASAAEGAIPDLPTPVADVAPPAQPTAPPAAGATGEVRPVFAPVIVGLPRLRVQGATGEPAALAASARGVEGVVHVAVVHLAGVTLIDGRQVVVAAVAPADFRALTPQITADSVAVWERLAGGDAVLDYGFGTSSGLPLGGTTASGGVPVRIGAYASIGTPPVADALVDLQLGRALGVTSIPATLYAAPDPAVPVADVAERLSAVLGVAAEVLPDPTARSGPVDVGVEITPENVWDHLALCESSGDWHINTGNGYYGGVQFLPESWHLVGGTGLPHEHPREEQIYRATLLWQVQGWEAWPQCSRRLGLIPA